MAIAIGFSLALLGSGLAWAQPETPDDVVLEGDALSQVQDLRSQSDSVQAEIDNLNLALERVVEEHNATRVNLDQLTMDLADSRIRLDQARQLRDRQEEIFSQRMIAVYKSDDINVFSILLNSNSFSDFYDQTRYIMKIGEQDAKLEKQLRETAEEIEDITAEIDDNRAEQMRLEQQLAEQETEINARLAERQAVYDRLDAEMRRIIDEEAARQRAERARAAAEAEAMLRQLDVNIGEGVRAQVVHTALQYLGVPYVWGGESPAGLDCSGLTKYVYAQHGVQLPHNAAMQYHMGVPVPDDQLQPGDLVFWGEGNPHHVGMFIGGGLFIEAPTFGETVSIDRLSFDGDYAGARRFPLQARG